MTTNQEEEVLSGKPLLYLKKILKKRLFLRQMGDIISSKRYHPSVFGWEIQKYLHHVAKEYFSDMTNIQNLMSCYHPNIISIEENAIKKKDGTPGYKTRFIPFTSHEYEEFMKENKDIKDRHITANGHKFKIIFAPCGMCQGCKTDRRKEWALRLDLESRYYDNNYFITLTYDDSNIIIPQWWASSTTGEITKNPGWWSGTLSKYHAERFMKSLKQLWKRKYNWDGMKYYIVGEYASRPHYHAILLNCPKIDLEPIGKSTKSHAYYKNDDIARVWGKGFITIGKVTWDSISYVAGYVNKKLYGKKAIEDYDKKGKIPEFALMSKGIGRKYLEENKDKIYENDEVINSKGQSVKPPRYFDRIMEEKYGKDLTEIKQKREDISVNETEKKLSIVTKTLKEQLKTEEEYSLTRQKIYNRERI